MKKRDKMLLHLLADMRPFVLQRLGEIDANLKEIRRTRQAGRVHDETLNTGLKLLGQPIEAVPGFTLDRVQAALDRTFSPSDLSEDEQAIFFELLGRRYANSPDRAVFAAELLQEAGNVGYDEAGNLVKTLGGGKVEIIKTPDQ